MLAGSRVMQEKIIWKRVSRLLKSEQWTGKQHSGAAFCRPAVLFVRTWQAHSKVVFYPIKWPVPLHILATKMGSNWRQNFPNLLPKIKSSTTGWAGGLIRRFKRMVPAALLVLEVPDNRNNFSAATSRWLSFYLLPFTGSPVNGSIYSFMLNCSYSLSSCNWFAIYFFIASLFRPTVVTYLYGHYRQGEQKV